MPPAAAAALALAELLIEDEDLEPDEPLDDLPPDDPLDLQSTSWSCETASTASRQMEKIPGSVAPPAPAVVRTGLRGGAPAGDYEEIIRRST